MNLKLLQTFATLADCLHFGVAAQRLCISQPALTKQIQRLEDSLGAPLFERGRHGTTLTALGHSLNDEAHVLLQQVDTFWLRAQRAAQGHLGRLAIGFGLSSIELAPKWVAQFRVHFPDVEIVLDDMSSSEQITKLISGDLQLGFIRLPVPEGLSYFSLQTDQLALASPGKPGARVGFDDVTNEAMIALLPRRGPGLARQIARFYELNGAKPKVLQYASDIQTVLSLVAAGAGRAILPLSAANIAPATVSLTPLDGDMAACVWQVGLVWNPGLCHQIRDNFVHRVMNQEGARNNDYACDTSGASRAGNN